LLRDLGSQLRRGALPEEAPARFPTGIAGVDRLLGGGFPRGQLSEIAGAVCSGRTSVALALLARTTRAGELAAVVDGADAFDPASAEAAGARLERVLWVRARELREALRSSERLLEARGIDLVLLDLRDAPNAASLARLSRAAAATRTALVLLSQQRAAGTAAALALELRRTDVHFSGTPDLLEGLESEAALIRQRAAAPAVRTVSLRLRSDRAA
jgi:RecA/RadA recombinase